MNTIKYTLATLAICFSLVANSQQISIGARGGATLGKVTRPDLIKGFTNASDFMVSGNGGVFAEFAFGEHFALRPELVYLQKGLSTSAGTSFSVAGVDLPIGAKINLRVSHIQMPILAQFSVGQGPVKGYMIAGPAMALATNAKLVTRPELLLTFRPIRTDVSLDLLQYKRFEVSAVGGAGVSVDLGGAKLMFEGRYEHGLTRVVDVPVVRVNTFNQNISFLAGVAIPLGNR